MTDRDPSDQHAAPDPGATTLPDGVGLVLACADLMTASRVEAAVAGAVPLVRAGTTARLEELLATRPHDVVLVDLTAFPDLPSSLGANAGESSWRCGGCVAFAPHVREELLAAARPHADVVAPRGAAVRSPLALAARALARRGFPGRPGVA